MDQQEILKREFEKKKEELEKEKNTYTTTSTEIEINLACLFETVTYKGQRLEDELIKDINDAIVKTKLDFEAKWTDYLRGFGINF